MKKKEKDVFPGILNEFWQNESRNGSIMTILQFEKKFQRDASLINELTHEQLLSPCRPYTCCEDDCDDRDPG